MVDRIGGSRRKTRKKFKKGYRQKGKVSLSRYFAEFAVGDRVALVGEPAIQKGLYHGRFHGQHGIVQAKRGRCYELQIKDGGNKKTLILHPVHLKKI